MQLLDSVKASQPSQRTEREYFEKRLQKKNKQKIAI